MLSGPGASIQNLLAATVPDIYATINVDVTGARGEGKPGGNEDERETYVGVRRTGRRRGKRWAVGIV